MPPSRRTSRAATRSRSRSRARPGARGARGSRALSGLEVLAAGRFRALAGRRVGLVCNPTAVTARPRPRGRPAPRRPGRAPRRPVRPRARGPRRRAVHGGGRRRARPAHRAPRPLALRRDRRLPPPGARPARGARRPRLRRPGRRRPLLHLPGDDDALHGGGGGGEARLRRPRPAEPHRRATSWRGRGCAPGSRASAGSTTSRCATA